MRATLIAGPTASGKSALALEKARDRGALIVNADALQVYDGLRIVTARPDDEALGQAPHRLYGTVDPGMRYSTGAWLRAVKDILVEERPSHVVFVGGTGLYFEALIQGFAEIPEVPDAVRDAVRLSLAGLDERERMALLREADPVLAERLGVADPQRVERALAVRRATGKPITGFHGLMAPPLLDGVEIERIVLDIDRDVLRERIRRRFARMVGQDGRSEVAALLARDIGPDLPAMRAIGVREIGDLLAGRSTEEEAIARGTIATAQYAKRQRTWLRNRMGDWPRLSR